MLGILQVCDHLVLFSGCLSSSNSYLANFPLASPILSRALEGPLTVDDLFPQRSFYRSFYSIFSFPYNHGGMETCGYFHFFSISESQVIQIGVRCYVTARKLCVVKIYQLDNTSSNFSLAQGSRDFVKLSKLFQNIRNKGIVYGYRPTQKASRYDFQK